MEKLLDQGDNQTSPGRVASNVLTSLILIVGAVCIEWLKGAFPQESPPKMVLAILNLGQMTLVIYFLRSLIQAMRSAYLELEQFLQEVAQSSFWQAIKEPVISFVHFRWVRVIRLHRPNSRDILKGIVSGLLVGCVVAILSLIIFGLAGVQTSWLKLSILILGAFAIMFLIKSSMLLPRIKRPDLLEIILNGLRVISTDIQKIKQKTFRVPEITLDGLGVISTVLLPLVIVVLILQLTDKINILYDILRFLYFRR